MSKHIFKYESEQAYAAAANSRPSDASNVALAGLLAKYHGINVITDTSNPEPGDACFFDKLEGIFASEDFTKAQVVDAIREFIPNFAHEEKGKNLDQKM